MYNLNNFWNSLNMIYNFSGILNLDLLNENIISLINSYKLRNMYNFFNYFLDIDFNRHCFFNYFFDSYNFLFHNFNLSVLNDWDMDYFFDDCWSFYFDYFLFNYFLSYQFWNFNNSVNNFFNNSRYFNNLFDLSFNYYDLVMVNINILNYLNWYVNYFFYFDDLILFNYLLNNLLNWNNLRNLDYSINNFFYNLFNLYNFRNNSENF